MFNRLVYPSGCLILALVAAIVVAWAGKCVGARDLVRQ